MESSSSTSSASVIASHAPSSLPSVPSTSSIATQHHDTVSSSSSISSSSVSSALSSSISSSSTALLNAHGIVDTRQRRTKLTALLYEILSPLPMELIRIIVNLDFSCFELKGECIASIKPTFAISPSACLLSSHRLASVDGGRVGVWDWKRGCEIRSWCIREEDEDKHDAHEADDDMLMDEDELEPEERRAGHDHHILESFYPVATHPPHEYIVVPVVFDHDYVYGQLQFYDANTGTLKQSLHAHETAEIHDVKLLQNGDVVSAGGDMAICVWSKRGVKTRWRRKRFLACDSVPLEVCEMDPYSSPHTLASLSATDVHVWDLETATELKRIPLFDPSVKHAIRCPPGTNALLVWPLQDTTTWEACLLDSQTGATLHTFSLLSDSSLSADLVSEDHAHPLLTLSAMLPNGQVVCVDGRYVVHVWDVHAGTCIKHWQAGPEEWDHSWAMYRGILYDEESDVLLTNVTNALPYPRRLVQVWK